MRQWKVFPVFQDVNVAINNENTKRHVFPIRYDSRAKINPETVEIYLYNKSDVRLPLLIIETKKFLPQSEADEKRTQSTRSKEI